MIDSNVINIDIDPKYGINQEKQSQKLSVRKYCIKKLWNYIISVIGQSISEWHLVVTRLGRLGHGEMREWLCYLNRGSVKSTIEHMTWTASEHLRPDSKTDNSETKFDCPSISSVCLTSLEMETTLTIFPTSQGTDASKMYRSAQTPYSNDKDKNQTNPLNNANASYINTNCSHLIIFPTSSTIACQKSDPNEDLGNFDDFDDDFEMMGGGLDIEIDDLTDLTKMDSSNLKDVDDKISNLPEHLRPKTEAQKTEQALKTENSKSANPNDFYNDSKSTGKAYPTEGVRNDITKDIQDLMNHVNQQPLSVGLLVSSAPLIFPGCALPSWLWAPEPGQGPRAVDSTGDVNASVTGSGKKPACLRMAMHLHLTNICEEKKVDKSGGEQVLHPMESESSSDALKYILERYNALSWLTADPGSNGNRRSCLPAHVCILLRLYRCLDLLHDLAGSSQFRNCVTGVV